MRSSAPPRAPKSGRSRRTCGRWCTILRIVQKLREYAIVCSSLYVHASALLNLCFCVADQTNQLPAFLLDVWEAIQPGNKSKESDLLLPGRVA